MEEIGISCTEENNGVPFYAATDLTKAAVTDGPDAKPRRAFTEPLSDSCDLAKIQAMEVDYCPPECVPGDSVTGVMTEKDDLRPGGSWMNP